MGLSTSPEGNRDRFGGRRPLLREFKGGKYLFSSRESELPANHLANKYCSDAALRVTELPSFQASLHFNEGFSLRCLVVYFQP